MKKFTKGCLIFAAIIVGIGLLFAVIGTAMGFRVDNIFEFKNIINGNEFKEVNFEFSPKEIKNLNIDLDAGSLKIITSREDKVQIMVKAREGTYTCYQDANTVVFNEKNSRFYWRMLQNNGLEVTVYLPENFQLEEGDLQLGVGEAIVNELNGQKISLDIGAGSFQGKSITAKETLTLSVGAGNVDMEQIKAGETVVNCGVGSVYLEGKIEGNVKANCGVGEIEFSIDGKEEDFNYQVASGIGDISINSSKYGTIANDRKIYNNGDKTFEIECGVGSIEININEIP